MRPVSIRLYAAIARHPRSFGIGAGAAIVLFTAIAAGDGPWWPVGVALLAVSFVAAGVPALPPVLAGNRPRFLLAREGAFLAPVDVPAVLVVAAVTAAF